MGKWIAVLGSPRRGKNTETLMDYYIEELELLGKDVEKFVLSEIELNVCIGCEKCIKNNICRYNDDITLIIDKMKMAEGIILGSPAYNYNVTSHMKILLDRLFSMFNFGRGSWTSGLGSMDKKAILIGVCAGPDDYSMGFTVEAMRRVMVDHGIEIMIEEAYFGTKRNPVEGNEEIRKDIKRKTDKIIVGNSAGAVVLGKDIKSSNDEDIVGLKNTEGLGLVDYLVCPHYSEDKDERLQKL